MTCQTSVSQCSAMQLVRPRPLSVGLVAKVHSTAKVPRAYTHR